MKHLYEVFKLFLKHKLFTLISGQTNLYYYQKKERLNLENKEIPIAWSETSPDKMKSLIGVIFLMGSSKEKILMIIDQQIIYLNISYQNLFQERSEIWFEDFFM